jgi:electron transfer flavoprotein alpha subunit
MGVPVKIACAGIAAQPGEEQWSVDPVSIFSMEPVLQMLYARWHIEQPDLLLFPEGVLGHELAVRLSVRLDCACYPEVRSLRREGGQLFGRKKVCSSNLDWEFSIALPAILTLRRDQSHTEEAGQGLVESPPLDTSVFPQWLLSQETLEPYCVNPLESARLVFAAGRGMGNAAACERRREIAARFGAPLGFSRPAALNGWGGVGDIVGQSGVRIRAECCIALGVSGAAAFMAGIESVGRLIAVNTDKNAPIFRYADLGIIAPAQDFMMALEENGGI